MTDQTTVSGSDAGRQDEQPDSFHRALSTTQAVQGLDAAAGVGVADAPQEFFCNKCGYFGPVEVFHERPNGSGKCDYMAAPMKASRCKVPPPGWSCSRDPGHEGPCAARPDGVDAPEQASRS